MCKVYFASYVMKYPPHGFASVRIFELNMRAGGERGETGRGSGSLPRQHWYPSTALGARLFASRIVWPSAKFWLDIYCI
jgi:hypothetical protein